MRLLIAGVSLFVFAIVALVLSRDLGLSIGWLALVGALLFAAPELRSVKISKEGVEFEPLHREAIAVRSKPLPSEPRTELKVTAERARTAVVVTRLGNAPLFLLFGTVAGMISATNMMVGYRSLDVTIMALSFSLCLAIAFGLARRRFALNLIGIFFVGITTHALMVALYLMHAFDSDDLNLCLAEGPFGVFLAVGLCIFESAYRNWKAILVIAFVPFTLAASVAALEILNVPPFSDNISLLILVALYGLTAAAVGYFCGPSVGRIAPRNVWAGEIA